MRCASCGTENEQGYKFCGKCGVPITAPLPKPLDDTSIRIQDFDGLICVVCDAGTLNRRQGMFGSSVFLECSFCLIQYHFDQGKIIVRKVPQGLTYWKSYENKALNLGELKQIMKGLADKKLDEQIEQQVKEL
jgi:hypothetical protein